MTSHHGSFVWYELMTTDTAAAEAFYRAVVGWDVRPSGVPGMDYTLFMAGESGAAGLMAAPAGVRPGWIGYVAVDDVDASAERFAAAGGAIHKAPADIPEVGRIAVVADPQGTAIALITPPSQSDGHLPPPHTPGHGGWRELLATDLESAFAFYAGAFGWTKGDHVDMGPMGIYQLFGKGTRATPADAIGGMMRRPPSVPAPFWMYYFNVDDIRAAEARIGSAGGQVVNGPHEVPGGSWIVQGVDPQGAMFALVQPPK